MARASEATGKGGGGKWLPLEKVCAAVFAGLAIHRHAGVGEGFAQPVINVSDLTRANAPEHKLATVMLPPAACANYIARAGDVVIAARGMTYAVAVVPEAWGGAVVSSNIILMRVRPGVLIPELLGLYLRSAAGRRAVEKRYQVKAGSALGISPASLRKARVPVPAPNAQTTLAGLLRESDEYTRLSAEIARRRAELVNEVCLRHIRATA